MSLETVRQEGASCLFCGPQPGCEHDADSLMLLHLAEEETAVNTTGANYVSLMLRQAAKIGDVASLNEFVSLLGDKLFRVGEEGFGESILLLAAKSRHFSFVRAALEAGVSARAANDRGRTVAHLMSELTWLSELTGELARDVDWVWERLKRDGVLDQADAAGERPLHLAVRCGATDNVKRLLELGANVNVETHLWERPLDLCAINGTAINELLTAAGGKAGSSETATSFSDDVGPEEATRTRASSTWSRST